VYIEQGFGRPSRDECLDIKAGHQNSTAAIAAKIDVSHVSSATWRFLSVPIIRAQDVFIVTFPTALHRYYYVNLDDAHANFVKEYMVGKVDASVADFENLDPQGYLAEE
jgi:hypothetical protein